MPGLRDILEAATPGRWRVEQEDEHGTCVVVDMLGGWRLILAADTAEADARLIALAPELAALVLDMGEFITEKFGVDGWLDDGSQALLARLDQLGKEPSDG